MEGKKDLMAKKEKEEKSKSLGRIAWKRLRRNIPAMTGAFIILFLSLVSILGANIRPDQTENASFIVPQVAKQKPGFQMKFLKVTKNQITDKKGFFGLTFFGGQENEYRWYPISDYRIEGTEIIITEYAGNAPSHFKLAEIPIMLVDVAYPLNENFKMTRHGDEISFFDAGNEQQTVNINELAKKVEEEYIVTKTYWLGTDLQGRDMLSRLMAGTIVSLSVGLISVVISLLIGITLGAIAGYYRGWVDDIIMWLINVVWSIPTLLLVIAITLALGKGFWQVFVAVGLTMWVEVARIVRGQVLSVREKEFIIAGRSLGFKSGRIIFKHVLPNIMGPVIVMSAANFASAILIESGLSFLSVGVQPPMPSWGSMISEHQAFFTTEYAYMAVLPGFVTAILVLSFMLVGNGLRDALDTRMIDDVKG
jgi:peptide/nickel transport system permease protein